MEAIAKAATPKIQDFDAQGTRTGLVFCRVSKRACRFSTTGVVRLLYLQHLLVQLSRECAWGSGRLQSLSSGGSRCASLTQNSCVFFMMVAQMQQLGFRMDRLLVGDLRLRASANSVARICLLHVLQISQNKQKVEPLPLKSSPGLSNLCWALGCAKVADRALFTEVGKTVQLGGTRPGIGRARDVSQHQLRIPNVAEMLLIGP